MVRTVEQVFLIGIHRWKLIGKFGGDMNMTGRAGAISTAQRQPFVEPVVTQGFH